MKFSSKTKFKLNTRGKILLIHATNKCHWIKVHILTYKPSGSYVYFLYDLSFIYRFYSVNFYVSYATKISTSTVSTPTIFMSMKVAFPLVSELIREIKFWPINILIEEKFDFLRS